MNDEELDQFNEINPEKDNGDNLGKDYLDKTNLVREKHRSLRDGYDRLQRIAARGLTFPLICYWTIFFSISISIILP